MVVGYNIGEMDLSTKDTGPIQKLMERGGLYMLMVMCMKEDG